MFFFCFSVKNLTFWLQCFDIYIQRPSFHFTLYLLLLYHQINEILTSQNFELESFQRNDPKAPLNQRIKPLEKINNGELAFCTDFFLHSVNLNVNPAT